MTPKDLILSPIYLYQAKKIARTAIRLPEATGERQGVQTLPTQPKETSKETDKNASNHPLPEFNLMIVGDSAAAGVGVTTQDQAFLGQLLINLTDQNVPLSQHFSKINWSLYATSGHTSFQILRRLYALSPQKNHPSTDLMIISVGVNDITANLNLKKWQANLTAIITIAQRKFKTKRLIFISIPPMDLMPSIPYPLNKFIGKKVKDFDKILQQTCQAHQGVDYLDFDFNKTNPSRYFAQDGFHPNAFTYREWAKKVSQFLQAFYQSQ